MVKIEDAVVARYSKGGRNFEILVDPFKAQDYLQGEEVDIRDLLAVEGVFKDASSADRVSEDSLEDAFNTTELKEVVDKILKKGEVHLTTRQRKEMTEAKEKQIVDYIVRNAINPQNDLPHPRKRIENVFSQIRVKIDPFKPASDQVEEVVDEMRPLIPLSFEEKKMALKIPAQYAVKSYSYLKKLGINEEEWLNDGSLVVEIEIPGGMQNEVIDKLNSLTKGDVEVKIYG